MASLSANRPELDRTVHALKAHGVVPAIADPLRQQASATARALLERVTDEIQPYAASANPEVLPELQSHLEDLVREVCRLLAGGGAGDLGFVRGYAQRGAQQRFPLEASLHAYRCSHRLISRWVRDAALGVADPSAQVRRVVAATADFAMEFTDAISTLATSEYVSHTRLLAEAEGDRRTELLNTLLSGYDESDARAAALLQRAGYLAQRQSFCVVVARSVDPGEMANTARAQRMADAVSQALRDSPVRALFGVRNGLVTGVLSATRRLSGWTAPQSRLADRLIPKLNAIGPAALIGLSDDAPSTSHVRRALHEARLALDFASVANRVVSYSQIPFRQMIIRHARENMNSALPAWLDGLLAADRKAHGSLSKTLRAYADANMNAQQAAKTLSVHPNTIYTRMLKIGDVTGKNGLFFHDLTELLLAMDIAPDSGSGHRR